MKKKSIEFFRELSELYEFFKKIKQYKFKDGDAQKPLRLRHST